MGENMDGITKIGLIGCGNIALIYLHNIKTYFKQIKVIACTDIFSEKAQEIKEKFGIPVVASTELLLSNPEIEIVLNLTNPAAHTEINLKTLDAGKHVYCEKPLALTLEDAQRQIDAAKKKMLRIGCAPDTFLGAGIQTSKKVLDTGLIGKPLAATANIVNGYGHEIWHPNPEFYYKSGAGPMLDMGIYYVTAMIVLLGEVRSVSCFAKKTHMKRTILSQPLEGKEIDVEVNTHYAGIMTFANGVIANITSSWDIWQSHLPKLEIYGSKGTLTVPDPNMFGGKVTLLRGNEMADSIRGLSTDEAVEKIHSNDMVEFFKEFPLLFPNVTQNYRGLGLADMIAAIRDERKHSVNCNLAFHVLEVLVGLEHSAQTNSSYQVQSTLIS
jgi:predicted dehydrogenase